MIQAVKGGCRSEFERAVARGANANARDFHRATVLEVALAYDRYQWVDRLVAIGADPNQAVGRGTDTLLHRCARSGDIGFSLALLDNGASVAVHGRAGQTPLHLAVRHGFQFLAILLIDHDADVNGLNDRGETPLHIAARTGNCGLIQTLLQRGADPTLANREWYTPLEIAVSAGHLDAVQQLFDSRLSHKTATARKLLQRVAELHRQTEIKMWLASQVVQPTPAP